VVGSGLRIYLTEPRKPETDSRSISNQQADLHVTQKTPTIYESEMLRSVRPETDARRSQRGIKKTSRASSSYHEIKKKEPQVLHSARLVLAKGADTEASPTI
jgi:hypothetical protein